MRAIKTNKSQNFKLNNNLSTPDSSKEILLTTSLNPTPEQITDWLRSPQIKQWLNKLPMGIPNTLKTEMMNTIIKNILDKPDKDHQAQFGTTAAIGVNVLRWELWAFYRLPYAHSISAPDCPYTLQKHLEGETDKSVLGFGQG